MRKWVRWKGVRDWEVLAWEVLAWEVQGWEVAELVAPGWEEKACLRTTSPCTAPHIWTGFGCTKHHPLSRSHIESRCNMLQKGSCRELIPLFSSL